MSPVGGTGESQVMREVGLEGLYSDSRKDLGCLNESQLFMTVRNQLR